MSTERRSRVTALVVAVMVVGLGMTARTVSAQGFEEQVYGISYQTGVTDTWIAKQIDMLGFDNLFDFVATDMPYPGGLYEVRNTYFKSWAQGLFKRSWVWYDDRLAGDEIYPFPVNKLTGRCDLTQLNPAYVNLLAQWLADADKYEMHIGLTLFDMNGTGWNLYNPVHHQGGSYCRSGSGPGINTCGGHVGNPWYPGNNDNYTAADLTTTQNPGSSFFSARNEPVFNAQLAYIGNIIKVIQKVYPDPEQRSRVVLELIHEPPGDNLTRVVTWMRLVANYIHNLDPDIKVGMQINSTNGGFFAHPDILTVAYDIITAEMGHDQYSWWQTDYPQCTLHTDNFVQNITFRFGMWGKQHRIILDTDGSHDCRNDLDKLRWAVYAAKCNGASFSHDYDIYYYPGGIDTVEHNQYIRLIWEQYNWAVCP